MVAIGDIFYKDGINLVSTYETSTVDMLVQSATSARQAQFSFTSRADYDIIDAAQRTTHSVQRTAHRISPYQRVLQTWDFKKPCLHCGCIFLQSEISHFRVKCCKQGTLLVSTTFPHLLSLPPQLEHLAVQKVNHMTNSSSYYNGALQLGNLFQYILYFLSKKNNHRLYY
jgi:hypothetical protein